MKRKTAYELALRKNANKKRGRISDAPFFLAVQDSAFLVVLIRVNSWAIFTPVDVDRCEVKKRENSNGQA